MSIPASQHDGSSGRLIYLGEKVEYCCLTRTIGTDKSADFGGADSDVKFVNRYKTSEINSKMSCLKNKGLSQIFFGNEIGAGYIYKFYFGRLTHYFLPPFESFILSFLKNVSIFPLSFSLLVTSITRIRTIAYTSIR